MTGERARQGTKAQIDRSNYFYDRLDAVQRATLSDKENRKADAMTKKQRQALYEKRLKEVGRWVRRGKWGKPVPMYSASVNREADAKVTIVRGKPKIKITKAKVTLGKLKRARPKSRPFT